MKQIYYIGGSPCCGKSTAARQLAEQLGWYHFEADEYLEACVKRGAKEKKPYCMKQATVYGTEKWQRDPVLQAKEEVLFYKEIFPYMMEYVERMRKDRPVIAEGAVFLPMLMKEEREKETGYVCMIPEELFQIEKYKERSWARAVVETCENPEFAFTCWMQRDHLFAKEVKRQAEEYKIPLLCIDGSKNIEETINWISHNLQE